MAILAYQEVKQFLERAADQYYVRRATFWDISGGRTRVLFELKNVKYKALVKKFPGTSPANEPACEHTFRELSDLLEKFSRNSPDGKVSFSETELGISIMFDMTGLKKSLQNGGCKTHTIDEAKALPERNNGVGTACKTTDSGMKYTRMIIQLEETRYWFLSIFFDNGTGALYKYCLDYEGASDSHYEFRNESAVRKALYQDGDEDRFLDEIFIRYIAEHSGFRLLDVIEPYITAQFHYD